ncbi:MAG: ribulose-bisphosphate carboxylase [Candidatus Dojkabacteria bacterium]|nr:MAG: ribulose-bisphosphate carboxylase [Candidatus Dojkabacteria bacterium]
MQKQYISLGNKDVYNGEYLLAAYRVETYGGQSILEAASEMASESSTGSNLTVGSATGFSKGLDALVYEVDEEKGFAYIAYPWRMFDQGGNIQNILTFIAGNLFGMGNLKACKMEDVYFPSQMMSMYDGPSVSLEDLREYLQVYDRPILGTIIKPKIGLTTTEYAELCYDFWIGGGDFVKNDEPQANQDFAPFDKEVVAVRHAMDMAEDKTGRTKVHSFNISAPDFDTMIQRADHVRQVMKPGSYSFLVDGITAGWMAIQTVRRRYPDVFLHFHRAGHAAFTRKENAFGFSVPVLTKFARLAGASGIHCGTAGVGKMDAGAVGLSEDVVAVHQCLKVEAQGHHFKQVWSKVPETDSDVQTMIKAEENLWNVGPLEVSRMRREINKNDIHAVTAKADWRTVNRCTPIASGGMNPVLLADYINAVGTIDFIITMGAGVHSHPMKTTAGMKAVMEAFRAWQDGKTLEEAVKDKEGNDIELATAIRFYNEKGTQAHRIVQDVKPSEDKPSQDEPDAPNKE